MKSSSLLIVSAGAALGGFAFSEFVNPGTLTMPQLETPTLAKVDPRSYFEHDNLLPAEAPPDEPLGSVVPMPDTTLVSWIPVISPKEVVGEWVDVRHKPIPLVTIKRLDAINDPYHIKFRSLNSVSGGCVFYGSGEAHCEVYDSTHRVTPRKMKSMLDLSRQGPSLLRIKISGVINFIVTQKKGINKNGQY